MDDPVMTDPDPMQMERLARTLEGSGRYRVLRPLTPRVLAQYPAGGDAQGGGTRLGMFLDLETTGLSAAKDEIIEFGIVPFVYTLEGKILGTLEPFSRLREPSCPIPPQITALTGITPDMVAGQRVTADEVAGFVAPASLIIAHNANFDRKFAEAFSPVFTTKPWACSMRDVDWAAEGYEGRKLSYLGMQAGFWFDGHRAVDDCQAGIAILDRVLPVSERPALAALLDNARQIRCRIWAENAPYEYKDTLRQRGYRWNDGTDGNPRAWSITLAEGAVEAELAYLSAEVFSRPVDLPVTRITPWDRFSTRC
ncbi:DNA polymerase III polC-type [Gluconacetobacter sp. SXCC-1]|uniref:3'-5' exonuclease n=1 Tax=Komagataeibacter rhaeticus TaxID=215221 RepID=A0A181CDC3_9PROT|nr:3'-5' exonuclease [Komagataeibacter rhaeticus]ATU71715.1 3'-5' exonuclease [Komagataeibacter xylinus]EGG77426.1 DNA polymerase III polC-type [Gluconacetobacter sp. SXCC-1]QIP36208.1 3'-5' exonuclease [Komagataeibacter rhaeticus]QOC45968.1 3'-5' exonuclease [Komagataeibacter rhaeticus]WPP21424.1 3'-5' exonuclease [Komagataeibacter rhaeticus]